MHRSRCGAVALMLATMVCGSATLAHPHHWIDVYAEWQFDATGAISGVTLRWLFDDYYSILLVDDASATGEDFPTILGKVLGNTAKHGYFIQAEQRGVAAGFAAANQARIGLRDHRIEITFHLPMSTPLDPKQGDIVYRVAEPTYYFEMLHAEDGPGIVLQNAPDACRYRLEPPTPDAALIAYAASLGIDQSGGDDLGIQFAETVTIRCG